MFRWRRMVQSRVVTASSYTTLLTTRSSGHYYAKQQPAHCRCKSSSSSSRKEEASKLHEELSQVMEQKKIVRQEQRGFVHFLKSNSSAMINIGATFFCVLLSYQIIALRRSGRVRQAELEESKEKLIQKLELLQSLTEDEFVRKMANECAESVIIQGPPSLWRRTPKKRDLEATMQSILFQNLSQRIGDAGLSEEQKKQRIMSALRDVVRARVNHPNTDDDETVEEAVEIMEDASGSKIVKKRVFSM